MARISFFILFVFIPLSFAAVSKDIDEGENSDGLMSVRTERAQLLKEIEGLRQVKRQLGNQTTPHYRPADCADLLKAGIRESGVYDIYPFTCSCQLSVRVYCDMETDEGGWTVLLKRESQSPQENFNRSWSEYKAGFGSPYWEYFAGLENIYQLTGSRSYIVRWDWTTTAGVYEHVMYDNFELADENSRYKLTMGTKMAESSSDRDCYHYNKNQYFSTNDRDSDTHSTKNCASIAGGGFWYYSCYLTYPPTGPFDGHMNNTCQSYSYGYKQLSRFQMKVRPLLCESSYKRISSHASQCGTGCNNP